MPVIRGPSLCVRAWLAIALASAAGPGAAHGGEAAQGLPWTFDPWVWVPLLLSFALYAIGYVRLRLRVRERGGMTRKALYFLAGWSVLAAAVLSPLHAAGERSFAAHMLEHELLMLVAAPLLVLSRPIGVWLWAFARPTRLCLARLGSHGAIALPWRGLTHPLVATALQAAVLWGWHVPAAFDLALSHSGWHVVQHLCFLGSALLFWWAMLTAPARRAGVVVACLFFTSLVSGALGALMAFSRGPWYAGYSALGLDAFGLSPAEDQQLAGLLMWVPGGLIHAAAGVWMLAIGLQRPSRAWAPLLALALLPSAARADTVYVSDEQANRIHVLRMPQAEQVASWEVGQRPRGMRLSADGRTLYVATSNDNHIAALDTATGKPLAPLVSGPDPERFALSPGGARLYVANEDDAKVSIIDRAGARVIAEVEVGAEPEGMAASPDGKWIICTSETASVVHFIDAHSFALVDSVPVGTRPRDAVFSADGRWLWVSSEMRGTVAVFDMRTRKIVRTVDITADKRAPLPAQAVGIALAPRYDRAFIALGRGNQVAEVEPASGRIVRYFPVGQRTWSVALSPDGKRLYATGGLSGDITVIDLVANKPVKTIAVGGRPWGLEVKP
ncbi:MAG TPA: PQQ-dependent catabolism-associated beta-propeller protein [Stenotrophomonas sp.]|nr:PQQ-dependent catabolism-associated beta-propeller protein [Stenotrophomonas sp.]